VERCPHFPDIFLTVGDWSFIIWQENFEEPLFVSPCIPPEHQLVAARWSPTRAGVIITALSSGIVEIWDLMDQIHHHSFSFKCSDSPIASLEFWRSRIILDPKQGPVSNPFLQYLAVGDTAGRMRLLQIPKNLRKKQDMREVRRALSLSHASVCHAVVFRVPDSSLARACLQERNSMRQFFDREIARIKYAKKRAAVRAAERRAKEEAQHALDMANQEKEAAAKLAASLAGLGLALPPSASASGAAPDAMAKSGAFDEKRSASALGQVLNARELKRLQQREAKERADKAKEEKAVRMQAGGQRPRTIPRD
jgi:hypothetical protein